MLMLFVLAGVCILYGRAELKFGIIYSRIIYDREQQKNGIIYRENKIKLLSKFILTIEK